MSFGLYDRDEPSGKAEERAYQIRPRSLMLQEEWRPEEKEDKALNTMEAQKTSLALTLCAKKIHQRKDDAEDIADHSVAKIL